MKAKSRSPRKRAVTTVFERKPAAIRGSGRLRADSAKIEARASLVGLTIYPPAEPPRKIPRSAFRAFE